MLVLTAFFVGSVAFTSHSFGQEKAGKKWPTNQLLSINKIDHEPLDELLQKYVDEDGLVDYKTWHANKTDRSLLENYLEQLSRADSRLKSTREAQLAYWINAYNATTIEGILRVYPTDSIRNHTAKLVGYNIWKNLHLQTGTSEINLDSIEHKVLRKMNEPRIHFAIVCASIGCPRLLNRAYTAEKIEDQLAENTADFFSRSQNLKLDKAKKKIQLSSIMDWFKEDFGKDNSAQLKTIWPYMPKEAKAEIAKGGYSFSYQDYDWKLNAQPEKKKSKTTSPKKPAKQGK